MEEEIWKPIPGYEGLYDASSFGRIRSVPNKVTSSARFKHRVWKSRIMKPKHPTSKKRQDPRVSLWKDGNHKDYLVSRLVAMAFHGIPQDGMTVNHINCDWHDNRPENLEWVTHAENNRHGRINGCFSEYERKVSLSDDEGNIYSFPSLSSASRYLGHCSQYLSYCIRHKHPIYRSGNKEYKIAELGDIGRKPI